MRSSSPTSLGLATKRHTTPHRSTTMSMAAWRRARRHKKLNRKPRSRMCQVPPLEMAQTSARQCFCTTRARHWAKRPPKARRPSKYDATETTRHPSTRRLSLARSEARAHNLTRVTSQTSWALASPTNTPQARRGALHKRYSATSWSGRERRHGVVKGNQHHTCAHGSPTQSHGRAAAIAGRTGEGMPPDCGRQSRGRRHTP